VKKVTAERTCWSCQRIDVNLADDLSNYEQLREACGWFKDNQTLESHQVKELTKLKRRREVQI